MCGVIRISMLFYTYRICRASTLSVKGKGPFPILGFCQKKIPAFKTKHDEWHLCIFEIKPQLVSITIYVICLAAEFIMLISMGFLLALGTNILEAFLIVLERLNAHVLPNLNLLNGLLALFVGFSIVLGRIDISIIVNCNQSIINPYTMTSTLSHWTMMIRGLV